MYKSIFIFIILDMIYLNISKSEYETGMGIKYDNIKLTTALISYACLIGSYLFIVEYPIEIKYLRAAIFGLGVYGVYNATNLAVYPNYTEQIAIRDTIWGVALCVSVPLIAQFIN